VSAQRAAIRHCEEANSVSFTSLHHDSDCSVSSSEAAFSAATAAEALTKHTVRFFLSCQIRYGIVNTEADCS
jgi:hypothetical protein